MARGVRKTNKQKLEEKLLKVQEAKVQYRACLEQMDREEAELREAIQKEEIAELSSLLAEKNMSVSDIKSLLLEA